MTGNAFLVLRTKGPLCIRFTVLINKSLFKVCDTKSQNLGLWQWRWHWAGQQVVGGYIIKGCKQHIVIILPPVKWQSMCPMYLQCSLKMLSNCFILENPAILGAKLASSFESIWTLKSPCSNLNAPHSRISYFPKIRSSVFSSLDQKSEKYLISLPLLPTPCHSGEAAAKSGGLLLCRVCLVSISLVYFCFHYPSSCT